nr:MAG TPA: DNA polymerase II large subunit [Bacteriophage sp.]DAQ65937.1 MAG TPA: DNA polymerase II large subunit [Bacteriophage sp.]
MYERRRNCNGDERSTITLTWHYDAFLSTHT